MGISSTDRLYCLSGRAAATAAAVFLWTWSCHAQPSVPDPPVRGTVEVGFENPAELAAAGGVIASTPAGYVTFEPGVNGRAARFLRDDRLYSAAVRFPAGTIDLSDADGKGKRLEFWLKFNEDPHVFSGNKFLLSAYPMFMVEIYGTRPFLAFEFYGNGDNDATGGRFLTYTQGWKKWEEWKTGEWHKITLDWRRNGSGGNAEMHLYIDGSQDGCLPKRCNDYRGTLPGPGSFALFTVGNATKKGSMDFSVDQMRLESGVYQKESGQ